jgi:NAD(P)-dependent dehydrogenase (short-subunit alcohol dehydrogenase family)
VNSLVVDGVSKVGVVCLTRILARDEKREDILINCCCPGEF